MPENEAPLSPDLIFDFQLSLKLRVELARRFAAEKNILEWGRVVFPEKFRLPFCRELHGYFVSIRGEPFTNTEAPRGHSKTTIKCVLIPQFQALYEPETFQHYLNVQATELKAVDHNRGIKSDFETNEVLREIFGDMRGERWTDHQFVLFNGVVFTAIGAGQSIRGLNYRQKRPDYIIVDDLYDEEEINNREATIKKNSWFWGSLFQAMAAGKRCSFHVQGTAINKWDILEELKTKARWVSRTFRAIIDEAAGISLWPEKKTVTELVSDRIDMGSVIFTREMQNERMDESESRIKRSWLTNWEFEPLDLSRALTKNTDIFLVQVLVGNDPSIGKEGKDSDYNGAALVYKTQSKGGEGNDYWIMGLWNARLTLEGRKNLLLEIRNGQKSPALSKVRIESIAGFNDYADYVIKQTNLPVERIDHVKDKMTTLESKSHFFENGKVHLNRNIEPRLKEELVTQLTTNKPQHDDLRDALLLCLDQKGRGWGFVGKVA